MSDTLPAESRTEFPTAPIHEDEEFVITSIASSFSATWRPGENPPDAYLTLDSDTVAVEISTLTQHVTDDRGTRSRLSDDTATAEFADALNNELNSLIPDGYTIGLVLSSPILKHRKTKSQLEQVIRDQITDLQTLQTERKIQINGNTITVCPAYHGDLQYKKVSAVFMNRSSSPDILSNAAHILEDRIATKMRKCAHLSRGPIWLALFNDYWLTDVDTYRSALSRLTLQHPFQKILLVNGDRSVHSLYGE
jgi:hypothetical protein